MRAHVQAVGKKGHRAIKDAGQNFPNHHNDCQGNDDQ